MPTERDFQIQPLVQESILHNSRTLINVQSLTASLFGVGAGILGLESYNGFLFYIVFSLITTAFFFVFRVMSASLELRRAGKPVNTLDTSAFFRGPFEFWTGGLVNGLAGYILTWTLFFGLVRA
ncbi:uncharacterized protein SPSK_09986 [Sporothrix schenckii 1099-18]|uniref:ER membrane protein complex subunit 6 n=3 Tax=Sporothrix TaxID=29907 RepID=U7Q597_SPOS1|nr:uncharacterized protein SPSK_09986 [Sporothrix schenckii 1099-18]XP_040614737.1 uncharacterized protein SPBR_08744 [Sporothrix brasiliensis 5110]ERT03059.1 hypothetical protein HMPREF1624_01364 [Sporothrix schenckii ATCC 58251]KIH86727.1 hypothetical protein SPBR_08744 [Sporothrix brasiliensis 5110]KJR84543.1 hypothetical protein SPSK_09986 [Sporothrix schenckii 1099-18]